MSGEFFLLRWLKNNTYDPFFSYQNAGGGVNGRRRLQEGRGRIDDIGKDGEEEGLNARVSFLLFCFIKKYKQTIFCHIYMQEGKGLWCH